MKRRPVVRERPVKTKRRMAELMWSWACTELGFSLIGIIRRMCSFGTYAGLIRGSLIVEKFSCAWPGRTLGAPRTPGPPAWALSKHRPFDSTNTRSQKLGSASHCLRRSAIMPPQRVPLMIKLRQVWMFPNVQIPGDWLFLLIVIYVGSHCCPTLRPFQSPGEGACTWMEPESSRPAAALYLHSKAAPHFYLMTN